MRRSSYFSLRRFSGRIFWAFVGLAALTMAASIGAFLLLNLASDQGQQQLLRQLQYSDAKALQEIAIQQRTGLELLTRFKVTNALDFVIQTTANSSNSITQMDSDFQSDPEAAAQFEKVAAIYRSVGMRFGAAKITNINPEQEQALYNQTKTDFDRLVQETGQLVQNRQQAANSAQATSRSVIDNTRLSYIAVAFFLIVIAVVFAFLLVRLFSRALARLTERLDQVAKGNLTEQMEPRGPDEIVELSLIFNRTVANLKLALARIQEQTGGIDSTSQRIKDLSTNQALNLSQQAIAVSQVSTTIVELSDTSQNIANSAALVADSAASALSSATDGFDTMLGANATMQEIRAKVNLIADRILALNAVAQRIREITLLIDTLSNETHLLALNAAIESAGAGEEGERFAVVAGHVRTLAQRSRIAAVEIQQLVSQIQQATANSVMATEEGVKVVALGEKMVNDSLLAHENIINQIGQTSQLAQAISQATDQQRVASTQVAQTMQQLSQLSSSVNAHSEQYMVSVSELGEIVNQLSAVVNAFQVQDDIAKENEAEETEPRDETYKIPESYPVDTLRGGSIIVS